MKLIVGLGNPGKKYEKTRHNAGFMAIDYYADNKKLEFKEKFGGIYCETMINNEKVLLVKPQSFMNLSGDVVRKYFDYYNLNVSDILIIYDDVNFDVGTFKIKRKGSSGGHNGINDIIRKLNTEDIYRVKIGTSKNNSLLFNYVTGNFSKTDLDIIMKLLPTISEVINDFPTLTIDELMLRYNKKGKDEGKVTQ